MPLTVDEQKELDSLTQEFKPLVQGLTPETKAKLSPEEQQEFEGLRRELFGIQPEKKLSFPKRAISFIQEQAQRGQQVLQERIPTEQFIGNRGYPDIGGLSSALLHNVSREAASQILGLVPQPNQETYSPPEPLPVTVKNILERPLETITSQEAIQPLLSTPPLMLAGFKPTGKSTEAVPKKPSLTPEALKAMGTITAKSSKLPVQPKLLTTDIVEGKGFSTKPAYKVITTQELLKRPTILGKTLTPFEYENLQDIARQDRGAQQFNGQITNNPDLIKQDVIPPQSVKISFDMNGTPLNIETISKIERRGEEGRGGTLASFPAIDLDQMTTNLKNLAESGYNLAKTKSLPIREKTFQLINRVKSPQAKEFLKTIEQTETIRGNLRGDLFEDLHQTGLFGNLSRANKDLLYSTMTAIDDGAKPNTKIAIMGQKIRTAMDKAFGLLDKAGIKVTMPDGTERPIGYIKNYLPRNMLKQDVANEVFADIHVAFKEAIKGGNLDDQVLSNILAQKLPHLRPSTKLMIDRLMKQGLSPLEAIKQIELKTYEDLYKSVGSAERPRTITFPMEFYETDPVKIITRYVYDVTNRLAQQKVWGDKNKLANQMLDKIPAEDQMLSAETYAKFIGSFWKQVKPLSPAMSNAIDKFINFESANKVHLGTSFLPQITQTLISSIPDLGIWAHIKGGLQLFDKVNREWVRRTGVTHQNMSEYLTGTYTRRGKLFKTFEKISPFTQLNELNQYLVASATKVKLKDWYKQARSGDAYAKSGLQMLGVPFDSPLTLDKLNRAVYRFTNDSQLRKNIVRQLRIQSDPRWRAILFLKNFGINQMLLIRNSLSKQLKRGVIPTARYVLTLAAGGILGGEYVIWANNKLSQLATGEPYYRDEDRMWQRLVNDIAATGTLGMLTNVTRISDPEAAGLFTDMIQNIQFAINPLLFSDIKAVEDIGTATGKTAESKGFGQAAQEVPLRVIQKAGGTVPRLLAHLVETKEMKKNRINFKKSDSRQRAMDWIIDHNDYSTAEEIIQRWNEHYPENPLLITPSDITQEALRREKVAQ